MVTRCQKQNLFAITKNKPLNTVLKEKSPIAGSNVSDTARRLNEKYGSSELPANLLRQINSGTIPFWKVWELPMCWAMKLLGKRKNRPKKIGRFMPGVFGCRAFFILLIGTLWSQARVFLFEKIYTSIQLFYYI